MDLNFFADPGLVPKPRSEIRIENLTLTPYPDGRRVRVELTISPFAPGDRPNLTIAALNPDGLEVGATTIIEAVVYQLALTMHLREAAPQGEYKFQADLYYGENPSQHTVIESIHISPGEEEDYS